MSLLGMMMRSGWFHIVQNLVQKSFPTLIRRDFFSVRMSLYVPVLHLSLIDKHYRDIF